MRKGLGIVGIIILLLVLFFILTFIGSTVIPAIKTAPEAGKEALVEAKLLPEEYYKVTVLLDSVRGAVKFNVWDPKNNFYVTDFSSLTGYQVYEDKIPVVVKNVDAFTNISVAIVVDPNLLAKCNTVLGMLKTLEFNGTQIGTFPASGFNYFKNAVCVDSKGDYWSAVQEATQALPSGKGNYNALLIISNGDCTTCKDVGSEEGKEILREASLGLIREDIQDIWIITDNVDSCSKADALNMTSGAIGIDTTKTTHFGPPQAMFQTSADGTRYCGQFSDGFIQTYLIDKITNEASTINLQYSPIGLAGEGIKHTITVKATKRPYSGKNNITLVY